MKSKIYFVWLVALLTMPLYMHIPVVGTWLVLLLVAGPMTIPVLKWYFTYDEGSKNLHFKSSSTDDNRAAQQEAMNQQDMLARLDSRFDYNGKYH